MHARHPFVSLGLALGLLALLAVIGCAGSPADVEQERPTVEKVDLGDYEVVEDWPKPLPDDDLSHDGWTWGSGAGVWVETPDKVWVSQRSEIELEEPKSLLVRHLWLPVVGISGNLSAHCRYGRCGLPE